MNSLGGIPYQYQGVEKDPETNLLNFELRQYDARLGRWQNTDPYGQHHSPYLSMSNNPVSFADPTGGTDYYVDGMQVSGMEYNLVAGSGNIDSYSYGNMSYGSELGAKYNDQVYLGASGVNNAFAARDEANRNYLIQQGYSKYGNEYLGYSLYGSFYGANGNVVTDAEGFGGHFGADIYTMDEIYDYYGLAKPQNRYSSGGIPIQEIDMGRSAKNADIWRQYGRNFNDLADAADKAIITSAVTFGAVVTGGAVAEAYGLYAGGAVGISELKFGPKLLTQSITKFPNLATKFAKHGKEFTSVTMQAFYKRAVSLANTKPAGNILGFTSKEGWIFRMNSRTGEFVTVRPSGEIATFFRRLEKPLEYWAEQVKLYGN